MFGKRGALTMPERGVTGRLARNRKRIDQDVRGLSRRSLSAGFRVQYDAVARALVHYVEGNVIDLGAGDSPFVEIIVPRAQRYDTLDIDHEKQAVTYVGDIQRMPEIGTDQYDTAVCLQVLEHVPEPASALQECYRILRPGGRLILSAPHLSRLHDEPHDYYRYTCHGLAYLATQAGFGVEEIVPYGGIFSFLSHQVSTLVLTLSWDVVGLSHVMRLLNRLLLVWPGVLLDRTPPLVRLAPLGYVAVLRKPEILQESET